MTSGKTNRVRFGKPSRYLAAGLVVFALLGCSGDKKPDRKSGPSHLVEVATLKEDHLNYRAERVGSLRALRSVKLFNQEEGRVLDVPVREGHQVRKDQLLVKLDDRILNAQLDKARAMLKQARSDVRRLKKLRAKQLVAEETINRAMTNLEIARADFRLLKTRVGYTNIRAPFDGSISKRNIEPGDVAPKHSHLLTIIDPTELITDVQLSELALPLLKVGDSAQVRIDALGTQTYPGKIVRIHPTIDPSTRLGRLEVSLSPVPKGARPGQFCRVVLSTVSRVYQVVPFAALRRDAAGEFVYLYQNDQSVKRTQVESGLRLADKVEIKSGLRLGQKVVVKGFLGLSDGKKVRVVGEKPAVKEPEKKVAREKDA